MATHSGSRILNRLLSIFLGLLVSTIILVIGLFALEMLVRKIKPQITYSQAYDLSPTYYAPGRYTAFTLKPDATYKTVHINSLGYRGKEFSQEKPPGTYRILMLGDSFIFGWAVKNDNDTVPAILENILKKNTGKNIEVINAGFHDGFSPDSYYAYLKGEGLALKPDLIIEALYLQNDIADLRHQQWADPDTYGLPQKVISAPWRTIDEYGRLMDIVFPLRYRIPYLREWNLWILIANWLDRYAPFLYSAEQTRMTKEYTDYFFASRNDCIFRDDCFPRFAAEYDRMMKSLIGTTRLYTQNQIPYLFVFEPSAIQVGAVYSLPPVAPELRFRLQQKVMDAVHAQYADAPFFDLTQTFLVPNRDDLYDQFNYHWNADGNRLAAQAIAGKIQSSIAP